jgi:nucleoside-diphosphate-sugar epimerase
VDRLIVGCGYLGSRVAALGRARGDRVFTTTRSRERAAELERLGLQPIVCDVTRPETLQGLPAVGSVVYCVGFDRSAGRSMREVYVEGLGNVLSALPRPGRFIHVSSTGVYGHSSGEEVDETAATEPVEESGKVVLEAERLLRQRLPEAVVLRFAGIYGPGRLLRRDAIEKGEPLVGDPERWLNLIHVEDGAAAVLAAEEHARPGEVSNVCDDEPARRGDFYALLAQLLGAPPPRFVPPTLGAPPPPHGLSHRRILNRRLREEPRAGLRYPSNREGLPASL